MQSRGGKGSESRNSLSFIRIALEKQIHYLGEITPSIATPCKINAEVAKYLSLERNPSTLSLTEIIIAFKTHTRENMHASTHVYTHTHTHTQSLSLGCLNQNFILKSSETINFNINKQQTVTTTTNLTIFKTISVSGIYKLVSDKNLCS